MSRDARQRVVQAMPDSARDYSRFPSYTPRSSATWYRQHTLRAASSDAGAWWFSSVPPTAGSEPGRFDLPHPEGTCYLATSPEAATAELIGPDHQDDDWVEEQLVGGRVISALSIPGDPRAANVSVATAARYGVTSELTSMVPYDVPLAWAAQLHAQGFDGIRYQLRFTPGARVHALALFGDHGAPSPPWNGDPNPEPVAQVARRMGKDVVKVPTRAAVTVIDPP